jgi:hypothetical protein
MKTTCEQLSGRWTDYLERRLPWSERLRAHLHVVRCAHCRRYVRQLRATAATLRGLEVKPRLDATTLDALTTRYREQLRRTPPQPIPWPARVLAKVDLALQGWRSVAVSLLLLGVVAAELGAAQLRPGNGEGEPYCMVSQAVVLGAVLATFAALAARARVRLAQRTWGVVTLLGTVGGFSLAQGTCGESAFLTHVLRYHIGGSIALALLAYLTLQWLLAQRAR